jgi:LysM repeat protein
VTIPHFFRAVSVLCTTSLFLGGVGCTSSPSPDEAADSTATSTTATVSQAAPSPAPPPSASDDRSLGQKLADATTETRVKQALFRTSALRVFPFRPEVIDGRLILRGDVNTPDQYHMAERVVGRVEGVESVANRLTMGGRSVTAERLEAEQDRSPSEADKAVYHTVRQGDTLWDIARKYHASVQQIRNLNDMRSSAYLRPGQRIRVR